MPAKHEFAKNLFGIPFFALSCSALLFASPAHAQFYKGKTLNVIINFGAGGNTDVQARTLMRYMAKYIPGSPRVVARNMPGAGGAVAANYLQKGAKKDGTMMSVMTSPWMHEFSGSTALTGSLKDLEYIGGIGQQQIAHSRKDIGITTPYDLINVTKEFKSAGHADASSKDISIKVTLRMLGVKHQHVTGFKSAGPIRRAILQNEVQYSEDSLAGYFGGVTPNLITPGISIPVWQSGVLTKDGLLAQSNTVSKDIPTFLDVYRKKHGPNAVPQGLDWELYKKIVGSRTHLRTIVLPPGSPKEAIADLRAAWLKTVKDKEYVSEYEKKNKSALNWTSGEEAHANIKSTLTLSPELLAHVKKIANVK
jgi:tripartite-type tricarboxylate transporter receptor subunit TctC